MALYSRQQLAVLFAFVAAGGVGLAIGHWRAHHPELTERLEQIDRPPGDALAGPDGIPAPTGSPNRATDRAVASPRRGPVAQADASASAARSSPPRARKVLDAPPGEPALGPVDLNRASLDDLTRLPGVGPVLAARIVEARDSSGRFASIDDLRRVRGVGPAKLDRLRGHVTVTE